MGAKKKEVKRVVFDTGVLVSALLFGGELSPLVSAWERSEVIILFSRETFDDLRNVLGYPKFSLTEEEVLTILQEKILPHCEVVDVVNYRDGHCEDPALDKFMKCAVSGDADFFVDGNARGCNGRRHRMVRVIGVTEFMRLFVLRRTVAVKREN